MAYGNQWMNAAMYKNMTNEQVDWASLAQQWIKIKETLPGMSPTEPVSTQSAEHNLLRPSQFIGPQNPSNAAATTNITLNDHNIACPVSRNFIEKPNAWNTLTWQQQQHWNWSSSTAPPTNVPTIEPINILRPIFNEPPPNFPMMTPNKPFLPINYWSGPNTRVPPPPPLVVPDQWNNKPNIISNVDNETQDPSFIDAAKRKQLPAWIREGLEKMEREKRRKIEQEQSFGKPQYSSLTNENFTQEVPNSIINFHGKTEIVDGDYIEQSSSYIDDTELRRTEFVNDDPSPLIPRNTKAQIWENTMLSLRKILTKLLMDVTNDMMLNIIKEVLKNTLKKGLGVYGSESESSNDSDEEQYSHGNNDLKQDSNEVIQKRILKRQQEFSIIEAKILIELDQLEEREKLVRSKFDNSIKLSRQINNNGSHIVEKERTEDEGSIQKIDKGHDKIHKEFPNDLNIKNAQKKNKIISKMSSSSSSSSSSTDSKESDNTDYKYSYRKNYKTKSKSSNKNTKTESLPKKRRSCSRSRSRSYSRSKSSRSHSRYRSRSQSRYYDRRSPQSIRSRRSRSPVSRHSYSTKYKSKRNSSSSSNESRSNKHRHRR